MRIAATLAIAFLAAASLPAGAACFRCGPIQDVTDSPVPTASGRPLGADEVRKAIVRGGAMKGWKMIEEGPGRIVGTLNIRTHTAVVEIPYSSRSYSIKYRSSVNLNEEGGQIHNNYNGWVKHLDQAIQAQLAAP